LDAACEVFFGVSRTLLCETFGDVLFIADVRGFVEVGALHLGREVLLGNVVFPEGMGVPIALAVPEAFFVATGILEVIRDVGGLLFFDVVQGGEVREARVALRGGGEVEAALGEEELAFWHPDRSEERRVGKECRSGWQAFCGKRKWSLG